MIEIDFVQLIQNSINVAKRERRRLVRTRRSLAAPLGQAMIRHTKTPIYGRRAPSTPKPVLWFSVSNELLRPVAANPLAANSLAASSIVASPIDISRAKGIETELDLLQEFQNLHHFLLHSHPVPTTKIPKLLLSLSRYPVISITTLAKDAEVSRDTARRWLIGLEEKGKLKTHEFNGMKQYAYIELIKILDRFVRTASAP